MEPWVQYAVGYIRSWIEFQVRASQQPGCIVAIAHRGKVVTEYAFGHANLDIGQKLTPRHRAMQILRAFVTHGAPKRRVRDWTGRWWSPWGAFDLVPMGNIVMAA